MRAAFRLTAAARRLIGPGSRSTSLIAGLFALPVAGARALPFGAEAGLRGEALAGLPPAEESGVVIFNPVRDKVSIVSSFDCRRSSALRSSSSAISFRAQFSNPSKPPAALTDTQRRLRYRTIPERASSIICRSCPVGESSSRSSTCPTRI